MIHPHKQGSEAPQGVADAFGKHKVAAIYLAHGTYAGNDAFGVCCEIGRYIPALGQALRQASKKTVDTLSFGVGVYTEQYAAGLHKLLNSSAAGETISVQMFSWSGENHHLGRADGAIRLIDTLVAAKHPPGSRVLLWGHSHAGNMFALLTNLLGGDLKSRRKFFKATRCYFHSPILQRVDLPAWQRVEQLLLADDPVLPNVTIDIATFGTPIRYGWETASYGQLLHFVNHRPSEGVEEYLVEFPPEKDDIIAATTGDYVQSFAIAGTDFMPNILCPRSLLANERLRRLLQPGMRKRDLLKRLQVGCRVAQEGHTLLVDYGPETVIPIKHIIGHAVYTRPEWMSFHAEQIAKQFYGNKT